MRPIALLCLLAACSGGDDGKTETVTRTETNTVTVPVPHTNTVTNTNTVTTTQTVTTTVTAPADAYPTVDAGDDLVADAGTLVQLGGSASDAEGAVTTLWSQRSGPTVTLSDATAPDATFTAPAEGTLILALEATDSAGQTTTDVVVVDVVPAPDDPPQVDAGPDQRVDEGTLVQLDALADDTEGAVTVAWAQRAGPMVLLDDPTALAPTFTAPTTTEVTAVVLELEATDDQGQTARDTVLITVDPVNLAPTVTVADTSVVAGTSVQLVAAAADADGLVTALAWEQTFGDIVVLSGADTDTLSFTAPASPGLLQFEVTVTDDEGGQGTARVQVEVTADPLVNLRPEVDAGADQTVDDNSTATLTGTATDPDGSIVSTTWVQLAGPEVALADPSALVTTFTAPDVVCSDALVFELTAVDDQGASRSDTVTLVVDGMNDAPVWNGDVLDFELDDGGLASDGEFEWGVPTSGPDASVSGSRVWASDLDGNYDANGDSSLCLPPLDTAGIVDPVLVFQAWADLASGDTLSIEVLDPTIGWTPIEVLRPLGTASLGWSDLGDGASVDGGSDYAGAAVELPPSPNPLRLRLRLQSNNLYQAAGLYLDDLVVVGEATDLDGDGLPGIFAEYDTYGLDPYDADVDDDGHSDGYELAFGSLPVDPADHPGSRVLALGEILDFELEDDGFVAEGDWERGAPSNGPAAAASGAQVWATDLDGNYEYDNRSYLYLPPVDLTAAVEPTLAFQAWADIASGEAFGVEAYDPTLPGWVRLLPTNEGLTVRNDAADGIGVVFTSTYADYRTLTYPLDAWVGEPRVALRMSVLSNNIYVGPGIYIDRVGVHEEGSDPDGDGLTGLRDEWTDHATDPLETDSDGDGHDDGAEIAAGTWALNAADYPGGPLWLPGTLVDFEVDDGGLVTPGVEWQWGSPTDGALAFSGARVWATQLGSNHSYSVDESLYLPPIDLTGAIAPVLLARVAGAVNNDELVIETWADGVGWTDAAPLPAYNATDGYQDLAGVASDYAAIAVDLSPDLGRVAHLRFRFSADNIYVDDGFTLDDLRVVEDGDDLDGDGLPSALEEILVHGTEPDRADSDLDGVDDGAEVLAGTDPTDPLSF